MSSVDGALALDLLPLLAGLLVVPPLAPSARSLSYLPVELQEFILAWHRRSLHWLRRACATLLRHPIRDGRDLVFSQQQVERKGRWWSVVTHLFVHADYGHLASNLLGLFFAAAGPRRDFGAATAYGVFFGGGVFAAATSSGSPWRASASSAAAMSAGGGGSSNVGGQIGGLLLQRAGELTRRFDDGCVQPLTRWLASSLNGGSSSSSSGGGGGGGFGGLGGVGGGVSSSLDSLTTAAGNSLGSLLGGALVPPLCGCNAGVMALRGLTLGRHGHRFLTAAAHLILSVLPLPASSFFLRHRGNGRNGGGGDGDELRKYDAWVTGGSSSGGGGNFGAFNSSSNVTVVASLQELLGATLSLGQVAWFFYADFIEASQARGGGGGGHGGGGGSSGSGGLLSAQVRVVHSGHVAGLVFGVASYGALATYERAALALRRRRIRNNRSRKNQGGRRGSSDDDDDDDSGVLGSYAKVLKDYFGLKK